ncbi:hypothetical protein [Mesorhizobium prunaredense]|uniref:hypothetical protein n=1 Tax=Mesorhizobium prunaredense TaxID=1631249 RepID=UPI00142D69A7|nr:hypothetical protein [Mesorhizobium prunaredense]
MIVAFLGSGAAGSGIGRPYIAPILELVLARDDHALIRVLEELDLLRIARMDHAAAIEA